MFSILVAGPCKTWKYITLAGYCFSQVAEVDIDLKAQTYGRVSGFLLGLLQENS